MSSLDIGDMGIANKSAPQMKTKSGTRLKSKGIPIIDGLTHVREVKMKVLEVEPHAWPTPEEDTGKQVQQKDSTPYLGEGLLTTSKNGTKRSFISEMEWEEKMGKGYDLNIRWGRIDGSETERYARIKGTISDETRERRGENVSRKSDGKELSWVDSRKRYSQHRKTDRRKMGVISDIHQSSSYVCDTEGNERYSM